MSDGKSDTTVSRRWKIIITVVVAIDSFWIWTHALKEFVNG